jgi:lipopolysaccharide cholinephosphotransferase
MDEIDNRSISLNELKKIELIILKYIREKCEANEIKYYICGGTLLGAIRHKGFIPWDDDIDIFMLRADYRKLASVIRADSISDYQIMSFDSQDDYYFTFMKVINKRTTITEYGLKPIAGLGVYVDVFPIDGVPDNRLARFLHMKLLLFLRKVLNLKIKLAKPSGRLSVKKIAKSITWWLAQGLSFRSIIGAIQGIASQYDYRKKHVGCTVAGYGTDEILPREAFASEILVEFENELFAAPIGYDAYLTNLYKNYMFLPPEEKRISHHQFAAFWKDHE